ncbi:MULTISPECIES: MarR family winged helix-turn-helix transcriptional regulator [Alcanivorax]|nr:MULTISPECIES: MarR family transcriptional regulator [Alcanivorax]
MMTESLSPEDLDATLETLHFAFRGLVAEPDAILKNYGLSRIHHRLLFFISRYNDLSVNELVEAMRLTKQAIHKPLKTLAEQGYVNVRRDDNDKRIKRLSLTEQGKALQAHLTGIQHKLLNESFAETGNDHEGWRRVMEAMARRLGG